MMVKVSSSSLEDSRWYEYLVRFVLGGAATVFTGIISSRFGSAVGGLFLALPAIFCASATLIERHEERRKREAGLRGHRRGQQAAALDAAGAARGSIGPFAFAWTFALLAGPHALPAFACALAAWCIVCVGSWWCWRHLRVSARARTASQSPLSADGQTRKTHLLSL
jgi:hypothetical protein